MHKKSAGYKARKPCIRRFFWSLFYNMHTSANIEKDSIEKSRRLWYDLLRRSGMPALHDFGIKFRLGTVEREFSSSSAHS